ncbi:MAG: hypothetical protein BYD32DRAFT_41216 [Podila humilis]|nr:MAG: hypothetical protein BYD32DRAFT_41216 [Podila humilis]
MTASTSPQASVSERLPFAFGRYETKLLSYFWLRRKASSGQDHRPTNPRTEHARPSSHPPSLFTIYHVDIHHRHRHRHPHPQSYHTLHLSFFFGRRTTHNKEYEEGTKATKETKKRQCVVSQKHHHKKPPISIPSLTSFSLNKTHARHSRHELHQKPCPGSQRKSFWTTTSTWTIPSRGQRPQTTTPRMRSTTRMWIRIKGGAPHLKRLCRKARFSSLDIS